MERQILLLGDPKLYEISEKVTRDELEELPPIFTDMFDCIKGIRRDYGFGRAIAAPQIGVMKRIICILTDKPYVIINPELEFVGDEMMELMDDCMSFPKLRWNLWMIVCHSQSCLCVSAVTAIVYCAIWTRTGNRKKCEWMMIWLNLFNMSMTILTVSLPLCAPLTISLL